MNIPQNHLRSRTVAARFMAHRSSQVLICWYRLADCDRNLSGKSCSRLIVNPVKRESPPTCLAPQVGLELTTRV